MELEAKSFFDLRFFGGLNTFLRHAYEAVHKSEILLCFVIAKIRTWMN